MPEKYKHVGDALLRAYVDGEPDRELIADVEVSVLIRDFSTSTGRLE